MTAFHSHVHSGADPLLAMLSSERFKNGFVRLEAQPQTVVWFALLLFCFLSGSKLQQMKAFICISDLWELWIFINQSILYFIMRDFILMWSVTQALMYQRARISTFAVKTWNINCQKMHLIPIYWNVCLYTPLIKESRHWKNISPHAFYISYEGNRHACMCDTKNI